MLRYTFALWWVHQSVLRQPRATLLASSHFSFCFSLRGCALILLYKTLSEHVHRLSVFFPPQATLLPHLIQSQCSNWPTAAIFSAPGSVEIKENVCSELAGSPKMSHTVGTKSLGGMDAALRCTRRELSEVSGRASVRVLAAGRWECPRRPLQVAPPLACTIPPC